ncbi:MAG: hypothetical protein ACXWPG_10760, partial [Ktedonobacteraceae bacterium]
WKIVGILLLLGCASGLVQQIPVSAMSRIKKEEQEEIANGSTLLIVLQATAAPLGVAAFSSIVQGRSQQYITRLASQGITGELVQLQSTLLAMRESFLLAVLLILLAFGMMCFVPSRRKEKNEQAEHVPEMELIA